MSANSIPTPLSAVMSGEVSALRRWTTVAGVMLIVLIIAADSYEAWQDYRTVISSNEHSQLGLSRALAEQTTRMVQEVDLVLRSYADWAVSPAGTAADDMHTRPFNKIVSEITHLPFVYSVSVIGPDGHLRATTQDDLVANADYGNRPAFTTPEASHDDALYIGQPFLGARDGHATFVLSRRIDDSSGVFAGVVVARVSLDYLASFYAGVDITPDTLIRMVTQDGLVLAQYPHSDEVITSNFDRSRPESLQDKVGNSVVTRQDVADYPILVEVSRSRASVLRPWVQAELQSAVRTLSLAVLAVVLLFALRAAFNRQQRLEADRRRLEHDLENSQRAQALGLLAASMAHDFNNALSAIVGYGELAQKNVDARSTARVNIDRLLLATGRARGLVSRVLTFNPHRSVNYQPLGLMTIVAEVLQQIEATLPPSISVNTDSLQPLATVRGDATEVYQVVMNLCVNAIHAMPQGGVLELRSEFMEVKEDRRLAVGELHPGRWLRLMIIDSGVGITAEQQATIFEPFYTTREAGQGTGIGLTVVRNIILQMNGALSIDSSTESGTRISVYWPLVDSASMPIRSSPREAGMQGHGETIMVVDDDLDIVRLVEEMLATLGYEAVGFTGADSALEALQRNPQRFDTVLTDENMRLLRGTGLAKLIHKIVPTLPVILITGQHDDVVDVRAREAGVAEILDKPVSIETLRDAIARQRIPLAS